MSEEIKKTPISFSVEGNLINPEIGYPTTTSAFSATNAILAIESAIIKNGVSLIPLKITANF